MYYLFLPSLPLYFSFFIGAAGWRTDDDDALERSGWLGLLALVVLLLLLHAALRLVVTDFRVDMGMGINKVTPQKFINLLSNLLILINPTGLLYSINQY
jgi:hypothetical protein